MSSQPATNLSFYWLVHHVLEAGRDDPLAERRGDARRAYPCLQWLAAYVGGRLPTADEFVRVQCVDLSSKGFSFLADEDAGYEYVVVALGANPRIFVTGEVIRRSVMLFDGTDRIRIGCRFIARLDENYQPALPVA